MRDQNEYEDLLVINCDENYLCILKKKIEKNKN